MTINELMLIVFLINIPFGYWRSRTKKFSKKWIMAIHVPIPFVFLLRVSTGFGLTIIPLLILSDIAGQVVGGRMPMINSLFKIN